LKKATEDPLAFGFVAPEEREHRLRLGRQRSPPRHDDLHPGTAVGDQHGRVADLDGRGAAEIEAP
jgi:hypothetical protein